MTLEIPQALSRSAETTLAQAEKVEILSHDTKKGRCLGGFPLHVGIYYVVSGGNREGKFDAYKVRGYCPGTECGGKEVIFQDNKWNIYDMGISLAEQSINIMSRPL